MAVPHGQPQLHPDVCKDGLLVPLSLLVASSANHICRSPGDLAKREEGKRWKSPSDKGLSMLLSRLGLSQARLVCGQARCSDGVKAVLQHLVLSHYTCPMPWNSTLAQYLYIFVPPCLHSHLKPSMIWEVSACPNSQPCFPDSCLVSSFPFLQLQELSEKLVKTLLLQR